MSDFHEFPLLAEPKAPHGRYRYPGDLANSKCHDAGMAVIYVLGLGVFIGIFLFARLTGQGWIVTHGTDSSGNYCGMDNTRIAAKGGRNFTFRDYRQYPFSYFSHANYEERICVRRCPSSGNLTEAVERGDEPVSEWCTRHDIICPMWITDITSEECACGYMTIPQMGRCIPDILVDIGDEGMDFAEAVLGSIIVPGVGNGMVGVIEHWKVVVILSLLAIVIGLIWIAMVRRCAARIVFGTAVVLPVWLIIIGVFMYLSQSVIFTGNDGKIAAYVSWALAGFIVLLIALMFDKLRTAEAIMRMTTRSTSGNFIVVVAPLLSIIIVLVFWCLCVFSSTLCYARGNFMISEDKLQMEPYTQARYLIIFNVIYIVFVSVHCYYVNYYTISGTVVQWYFNQGDKTASKTGYFMRSFGRSWLHGLGSITMISVVMTPMYLLVSVITYLEDRTNKGLSRFTVKCCTCCSMCFDRLTRYMNRMVITISQIYNTGFHESAEKSVEIFKGDAALTLALSGVSAFVVFLSKMLIATICATAGFLWLRYWRVSPLWAIPCVVIFALSYITSSFVLNVYDSVVDITLACYMSDRNITDDGRRHVMYGCRDGRYGFDDISEVTS